MTAAAHKQYPPSDSLLGSSLAVRPDRLTVWPMEDGFFGIDVRWQGQDSTRRATVVRLMLVEAGYEAQLGNSLDGRHWQLRTGPVPGDEVGRVIESFIW